LHYPAQSEGRWDFGTLLRRVETELDELAEQFGCGLGRRVAVFLFGSWRDITHVHGRPVGGFALPVSNAILIAEDTNLLESIRHELAHLYSARWNLLAPPLLNEGLAVWWQRSYGGRPIDGLAEALLHGPTLNVAALLNANFFLWGPRRDDCYLLAGGFTGFLIRRFGWENYRKFFRTASGFNYRSKFRRVFGVSLDRAERQWRCEKFAQELMAHRLKRA
jgi:hypothetical protein